MLNDYTIDLSLQPTTFDLWHVCLAATIGLLFLLILSLALRMRKSKNTMVTAPVSVEPEKSSAPAPETVVLKEASPDAALQLLGLLQKEARFIDFINEDITAYSDQDIGIAARVVHEGCIKAINSHFTLSPVRTEQEGDKISLQPGFDAALVRLTGNVVGSAPFTGTLIHKGWQVTAVHLPKLTSEHHAAIIAPAEVEL